MVGLGSSLQVKGVARDALFVLLTCRSCIVKSGTYVEIPAKKFLVEFTAALGLGAPVVSWRPGPEEMVVVGVQVNLSPGDSVPFCAMRL